MERARSSLPEKGFSAFEEALLRFRRRASPLSKKGFSAFEEGFLRFRRGGSQTKSLTDSPGQAAEPNLYQGYTITPERVSFQAKDISPERAIP